MSRSIETDLASINRNSQAAMETFEPGYTIEQLLNLFY